jgi:hypothetical protein
MSPIGVYLAETQNEVPFLISRWLLAEPSTASSISDDVGGISLSLLGSPTLGVPPIVKGDPSTCALGGYTSQLNGFTASVASFSFTSGCSIEGATSREYAHGQAYYLFNAPGQAGLTISGQDVSFNVWSGGSNVALTSSTHPITGPPQLVQGIYDPVAQRQAIYVDGALVISQTMSGSVATSTTGNTQLLVATTSAACYALGQDIAIYNGPLSANRVLEHFQAFQQEWQDPGHVHAYPYIGATT